LLFFSSPFFSSIKLSDLVHYCDENHKFDGIYVENGMKQIKKKKKKKIDFLLDMPKK
jgi:predicted GIY-YIG superfamily endonuclease